MTLTTQRIERGSNTTTSSTSFGDLSGMTLTVACGACGKYFAQFNTTGSIGQGDSHTWYRFDCATTNKESSGNMPAPNTATVRFAHGQSLTGATSGQTLKLEWRVSRSTATAYGASDSFTTLDIIEVI